MKTFKEFVSESATVKNGDFVEILSGIEKGRKGIVQKFFEDDTRCLIQLDAGGEFETAVTNVKVLPKTWEDGSKPKRVKESATAKEIALVNIAKSKQLTVAKLKNTIKNSTMPQASCDSLVDFLDGVPDSKVLKREDIEQICAGADIGLGEVLDLLDL